MTNGSQKASPSVEPVDEGPHEGEVELQRLDIAAHVHTTYEWNGYRYSNAKDAIAAAKRALR